MALNVQMKSPESIQCNILFKTNQTNSLTVTSHQQSSDQLGQIPQ